MSLNLSVRAYKYVQRRDGLGRVINAAGAVLNTLDVFNGYQPFNSLFRSILPVPLGNVVQKNRNLNARGNRLEVLNQLDWSEMPRE